MPRGFLLLVIQLHACGARQSPLRAVHDGGHHLQIAQQFGPRAGRSFILRLSLRFEKQVGLIQNAFADGGRATSPGGIQLPSFACIAVVLNENRRHPLAIFETLARHWHQELQGYLRRDLAFAHLLLDRVRQQFRQRQPP